MHSRQSTFRQDVGSLSIGVGVGGTRKISRDGSKGGVVGGKGSVSSIGAAGSVSGVGCVGSVSGVMEEEMVREASQSEMAARSASAASAVSAAKEIVREACRRGEKVVNPLPRPRPSTVQLHIAVLLPSWFAWQAKERLVGMCSTWGTDGGAGGAGGGGGTHGLTGRGSLVTAPVAVVGVFAVTARWWRSRRGVGVDDPKSC